MPTTPRIAVAAASAACAPVDSVASLDELYSHQLLCFCVARELHEAKAAMAEVGNLGVAAGLTQRVRVSWRLHPGAHGGACRTRERSVMLAGNSLQEPLKPRTPQTMLGMVCGKLLLMCAETTGKRECKHTHRASSIALFDKRYDGWRHCFAAAAAAYAAAMVAHNVS
jgi:hypothetical protein